MSISVSTPAAASTALAALLTGPATPLRVVGSGPWAAYLAADDGRLVAVTVPQAVVPPCALVVSGVRPDHLLPTGTTLTTGPAGLHWAIGGQPGGGAEHRIAVTRWWEPESVLPRGASHRAPAVSATRDGVRQDAADARALLRSRLVTLASRTDPEAARARAVAPAAARAIVTGEPVVAAGLLGGVLGLGPGLTPSGDDVATGVVLALLACAHRSGAPSQDDVRRLCDLLVATARVRTTTVSAALLAQACRGLAAAPVADAVRLLTGEPATTTGTDVVERLLAVGHHSGADLAAGMLAALDALTTAAGAPRSGVHDHEPTQMTTTFRRSA